ncbi:MAG TPA: ribbon-helix-helix protein, CopG family, partial [Candidatus Binatia bacterium]|nr:ribbon-helix-helix protein, CopG family [Candidatus Binatia bacterium]
MTVQKIAITIDEELLEELDKLISAQRYPNRSRAIQEAVREQLARLKRDRLARESAKLDRAFEQKLAEEGLGDLKE